MKTASQLTSTLAGLLGILATTGGSAVRAQEPIRPRYIVKDLGVLGSGTNSSGFDMNQRGWVGGSSNLTPGGPQHAFLWYGGGPLKDLGTLGGLNSAADGPNWFGDAPIVSEIAATDPDGEDFCAFGTHLQCRGAIWRFGKLKALRSLPGGRNNVSFGLNNMGEVDGWSESGVRDSTCVTVTPFQVFRFQAVIWEPNGEIRSLRPLRRKGDTVAFAWGINDRGQAVGTSGTCATVGLPPAYVTGQHAVLWERDGTPRYLGSLGDASHAAFNIANAINERGDVVGTSEFTDSTVHSFLWTRANGMKDIGTLPGAFATIAGCCHTVNDRDEVVGFSIDATGSVAFLWRDGVIRDLNSLIPADSPLHLLNAESMNDAGEITGQGCIMPACTELHAYRATLKEREER